MPDVKVYIRTENMGKWNAIEKKADWLNTLLANSADTSNYGKTIQTPVGPAITVLSETIPGVVKGSDFVPKEKDPFKQFMKDYSQPGVKPPHPEYGYPCCHKKSRCQHWVFNDLDSTYTNKFTNEIVEVSI